MRKYYGRGHTRDTGAPVLRHPVGTHCQICERDIMARNKRGLIAHHGYQRPYLGEQTFSCFGARWQPYEESRSAIPPCMDIVVNQIEGIEKHIARMKLPGYTWTEPKPKKQPKHALDFDYIHWGPDMVIEGKGPDECIQAYYAALQQRLRGEEHHRVNLNNKLKRLQARYDNWKPKESA